jgi:hypothetical protein
MPYPFRKGDAMKEKFALPMPCILEVKTAPSKSQPGSTRLDALLDLPAAQIGLGIRIYFKDSEIPADPRQFFIDQSNLAVRMLLADLISAKRQTPPPAETQACGSDRIHQLEAELADLKAKYDALFLGKFSICGDPS